MELDYAEASQKRSRWNNKKKTAEKTSLVVRRLLVTRSAGSVTKLDIWQETVDWWKKPRL
jgi:hypothetical protein